MQRNTDAQVLTAIEDNNMIFISAQPDRPYFHWQIELYLYQFSKHNILHRCYALVGHKEVEPSEYAKILKQKYPDNIIFYRDERPTDFYSPAIRPHLLAKFFKEHPELGKNVFYHDSDIFIVKLPRFDLMLGSDNKTIYLSDTRSYIGYEYIKTCAKRYKDIYHALPDLDIFNGMCEVVDMDPELIKNNQANSGGAQYLLKNIDYKFWERCEKACVALYKYLSDYETRYPISHHIQKWTTDMWVVLWFIWKDGHKTIIHKELDFSWATGTVKDYNTKNIFHLAGISAKNCSDKFYKGMYANTLVFDAYIENPNMFDRINPNNATIEYINVLKEYVDNVYSKDEKNNIPKKTHTAKTSNVITRNNVVHQSVPRVVQKPAQRVAQSPVHRSLQRPVQRAGQRSVLPVKKPVQLSVQLSVQAAAQKISQVPKVINYRDQRSINDIVSNMAVERRALTEPHKNENVERFKLICNRDYDDIYILDEKECSGRKIWRSEKNRYIIFWTGRRWVLTSTRYEQQIGPKCGGVISTFSNVPYTNNWNISNVRYEIL